MWIKKLELNNFQAHTHSVIEFNDKFNCIIGKSRAGKSSVVRALNFLFFDKWSDAYVRNGSDYAELVLHMDNGYTITRSKGNLVNKIIVNSPPELKEQPQIYEKFGISMPDPVRKILQIYPVRIDIDNEVSLNVADQDSGPFLLNESGPVKTKYLNRLTGSHVLDAAMRALNKDKSSLLTNKSLIIENVNKLTLKRDRFATAKDVRDKLENYYSSCTRIHSQVTLLRKVEVARQELEKFTVREQELNRLLTVTSSVIGTMTGAGAILEQLKLWQQLQETCRIEQDIKTAIINTQVEETALMAGIKQCPLCGTILKQ